MPVHSHISKGAKLFNSGHTAFVIVVCAAYTSLTAALIYSGRSVPAWEVVVLVSLGTGYLVVGTYGFAKCRSLRSALAAPLYFALQLSLAAILIFLRGSSGELALILLPLAGQSALLLQLSWMIPVCALIYLTLVIPFIQRSRWVDAVAIALIYRSEERRVGNDCRSRCGG